MLELMLDRHVIYVLMGMSTFAGVVSKVVVGRTLRKLVAAAESMGKSNHPLMRLVRAKFEHTCMISEKVENVGVFVDKYLYEYRVGGVRLHAWRRLQMAGAGLCLILGGVGASIVFLVHMLTDEEYRLEAVRNYMVDYLENIYLHRYEKTYKKEVLAEEARSAEARIEESARTQENAGMTKNTRMPEEERMGENTRMPEEERMGENTRMQENTGIVKNARMPENAGRAEGDNLPGESVNQKKQKPKQEPKQEFPGSMDSLLWAMYKTEPLQVEDDRKVKKTAISQKTGKTEKIEKTIESEETKAQDEANRNQRIREILEEFMA